VVFPLNHPTGAVVLGMDTSNVDSVFVAGQALKWRGQLVGVDVDRLLRKLGDVHERLMVRAASSAVFATLAWCTDGAAGERVCGPGWAN
jgi:hypothetical protein